MCGIAGIVDFRSPVDAAVLDTMNQRLAHRGPDDAGTWIDGGRRVGLATRRLAIIDLSAAGHQPMASADGAQHITFNGEIYNYLELRTELQARGHMFRTGSDTEVILNAYREWGVDCVTHFNGMFAFAIWDAARSTLFAARDRFGEKPFYYHHTPACFVFASEVTSLLADPRVPRRPNPRAVARFLTLALVDGEEATFFDEIRQLPPAHRLQLDAEGRLTITRYWNLDLDRVRDPRPAAADAEEFRALFRDAVRIRLRSDVPVGSSLSGGMDSSSIVCTIGTLRSGGEPPQNTFSARYQHAPCDEGAFIDAVTAHARVSPHVVWVEADQLVHDIERFVAHQEEPVAGTSPFAQWKVMELAAKEKVTVLLDGQGADEVIGGYPSPSFGYRYAELARHADFFRLGGELAAFRRTHGTIAPALRYLGAAVMSPSTRASIRARYFGSDALMPDAWHYLRADNGNGHRAPRSLRESLYEQATLTSLPSLLRYADRNSMAFSRESRLPFLDHRLVEFVFTLPADRLVSRGRTKVVLRDAMTGIVPGAVLNRTDKVGFATPERDWMMGPLKPWLRSVLDRAKRRAVASPAAIDREWDRVCAGVGTPQNLWRIANLELWQTQFIDRPPA